MALSRIRASLNFDLVNGDVVTLVVGTPVAQLASSLYRAINSSGFALANVVGLVVIEADPTMLAKVQTQGPIALTTAQWDAISGGAGGLVPGARYYLDATLGQVTTTPTSTLGRYVVVLGSAVSSTILLLDPEPPILL